MMQCECEFWKPQVEKINSYIVMGVIHGMSQYDGELLVYCPWCGTKLEQE